MAKSNTAFKKRVGQFLSDSRGQLLPDDMPDEDIKSLATAIACIALECQEEAVSKADEAAAVFSELAMVSLPNNKSKQEWALYIKTWRQPLEKILEECGEAIQYRDVMQNAINSMSDSGLTIFSPLSIFKVTISMIGQLKRSASGKGGQVIDLNSL